VERDKGEKTHIKNEKCAKIERQGWRREIDSQQRDQRTKKNNEKESRTHMTQTMAGKRKNQTFNNNNQQGERNWQAHHSRQGRRAKNKEGTAN